MAMNDSIKEINSNSPPSEKETTYDLEKGSTSKDINIDQMKTNILEMKGNSNSNTNVDGSSSTRRSKVNSIQFLDLQSSSNFLLEENHGDNIANADKLNETSTTTSNAPTTTAASCRCVYIPPFKPIVLILGLVLGLVLCFVEIQDNNHMINQTLAIAIWMATLWLTEAIPLVVTAFLPLVLFPLFGILSSTDVADQYVNNTIFLLISGFLVALTLERWNLHRRISLKILTLCGGHPPVLLFGMMASTFFLSMFISNTATTLMMVPNALSVCASLEDSISSGDSINNISGDSSNINGRKKESNKKFTVALMLGIAYAANVGGMSSLIGTAPNLVFQNQMQLLFPDEETPEFTFAHWISFALPTGLVMLLIIWVYLCTFYLRNNFKGLCRRGSENGGTNIDSSIFKNKYAALGPWSREQISVCILFVVLCLLWIFRKDLTFGNNFVIKGWINVFPEPSYISDATAGMIIVLIMFIFPARKSMLNSDDLEHDDAVDPTSSPAANNRGGEIEATEIEEEDDSDFDTTSTNNMNNVSSNNIKHDTTLLDWDTANSMPYDIVFLLGGGFALAKAFVTSGLSAYLGEQMTSLNVSTVALVFINTTLIIWLTELTSNTATSNVMIPIAASIAVASKVSPYTFMIPATMACSCAFVLPIATPPNSVVFSTGRVPMHEMNKAGIFLNIICSIILLGATFSIVPSVLKVGAFEFPSWAQTSVV